MRTFIFFLNRQYTIYFFHIIVISKIICLGLYLSIVINYQSYLCYFILIKF